MQLCSSLPVCACMPTFPLTCQPLGRNDRCFSNFFQHAPMTFIVPECCCSEAFKASDESPAVKGVTFSEKSIMLCKAAVSVWVRRSMMGMPHMDHGG